VSGGGLETRRGRLRGDFGSPQRQLLRAEIRYNLVSVYASVFVFSKVVEGVARE
jgi:hypothetical protein